MHRTPLTKILPALVICQQTMNSSGSISMTKVLKMFNMGTGFSEGLKLLGWVEKTGINQSTVWCWTGPTEPLEASHAEKVQAAITESYKAYQVNALTKKEKEADAMTAQELDLQPPEHKAALESVVESLSVLIAEQRNTNALLNDLIHG